MVSTWGGPDLVAPIQVASSTNMANGAGKPKLDGFDQFMMTRFSPLCWGIPSNAKFDFKDAQGKQVLGEAAALQKTIYAKTGQQYLTYLRDVELSSMGMDGANVDEYLNAMYNMDTKNFQQYFKVRSRCDHPIACKILTSIHIRILYKGMLGDYGEDSRIFVISKRFMHERRRSKSNRSDSIHE